MNNHIDNPKKLQIGNWYQISHDQLKPTTFLCVEQSGAGAVFWDPHGGSSGEYVDPEIFCKTDIAVPHPKVRIVASRKQPAISVVFRGCNMFFVKKPYTVVLYTICMKMPRILPLKLSIDRRKKLLRGVRI